MNLIRVFVRRPVTTAMLVMVFVVLGFVSYNRMVIDLLPELDFPLVQVITVYPGAGPDEIETQIIKKIEDEVSNISDIEQISAEIQDGFGFILVQFKLGVDVDIKALDVKDKIELIKRDLPDGAEDPVVAKFDPLSQPVVKIALVSDRLDQTELYELADKELKNFFGQVSGVAKVEILGGAERQINVFASLPKLSQYGMSLLDLFQTIGQQSINVPAGNIDKETREVGVRFKGEATTVEEVRDLAFLSPVHGVVRVRDVARVMDGSEDFNSVVSYKGKESVLLDVYKRSDGNSIKVADGIYKRIEQAGALLPEGVELAIADDTSNYIRDSVANAVSNVVLGVLLCSLVLYLFLGDVRITVVAALVIPTSIVSAFLLMEAFGFTKNIITLSALGISIGTLVANAIVVLESIARRAEMGDGPRDAAIMGTSEIAVAVLAAAGTNIVVFTPIAFMGGIPGQFFYPFGLTVVFATIFSIIASFSLTPMLASVFMRAGGGAGAEPRFKIIRAIKYPVKKLQDFFDWVRDSYSDILKTLLNHPWLTILGTVAAMVGAFSLFGFVGFEFFPPSDQGTFMVKAQLPKGANEIAARRVMTSIEEVVQDIPELQDYTAQAGGENVSFDEITVRLRLIDLEKRERSQDEIMYSIQDELAKIPGAEIYTRGEAGGPGESDIDINVYGTNYNKLIEISQKMRDRASDIDTLRAVFNTYREPKDEVHFFPDGYTRANYMMPNAMIGINMRYSIEGEKAAVMRTGGEEYDIKVRLEKMDRDSESDPKAYKIGTPLGMIPMSQLGKFDFTKGVSKLFRLDKRRVIYLRTFIAEGTQSENIAKLDKVFSGIDFPDGFGYSYGGSSEELEKTQREIQIAFTLAVIMTYMLLAAILNSFIHPLTILVTVPLGVVGVVLALFFSGISMNLMSMMAIVMLVGIVVNNGILIIDYALQKLQTCDDTVAECVREASTVRFRAILMANVAIVAGIMPQVFGGSGSEFMVPMGAATIGGVIVSTIFTFFAVPALFLLIERGLGKLRGTVRSIATGHQGEEENKKSGGEEGGEQK